MTIERCDDRVDDPGSSDHSVNGEVWVCVELRFAGRSHSVGKLWRLVKSLRDRLHRRASKTLPEGPEPEAHASSTWPGRVSVDGENRAAPAVISNRNAQDNT